MQATVHSTNKKRKSLSPKCTKEQEQRPGGDIEDAHAEKAVSNELALDAQNGDRFTSLITTALSDFKD